MDTKIEEKERIELWKNGINPFTKRKIKVWGETWILLMEQNRWHAFVPILNKKNEGDYSKKYLNFIKSSE